MSENQQVLRSIPILSQSVQTTMWKGYFERAMRESDSNKLLALIHHTENALLARGLEMGTNEIHNEERDAMGAACNEMSALKIEKLGWPDPCA